MIGLPSIGDPVIRYNNVNTTLTNATIDLSIDEFEGEFVQSVINWKEGFIEKGERFLAEITVTGISKSTYNTLKGVKRKKLRLWPFGVGAVHNTTPQKYYPYVDVIVREVRPFHHNNMLFIDGVVMKVVSESHYTLEYAVDTGYTESGQ